MNNNLAIQLFEGKQVRIAWNEELEKYYFSVTDIVQVLTDSKDAKQYIKRMRARDPELNSKWGTICTPVEMIAPDGKRRKTQAADLEGVFSSLSRQRKPSLFVSGWQKWPLPNIRGNLIQRQWPKANELPRKVVRWLVRPKRPWNVVWGTLSFRLKRLPTISSPLMPLRLRNYLSLICQRRSLPRKRNRKNEQILQIILLSAAIRPSEAVILRRISKATN